MRSSGGCDPAACSPQISSPGSGPRYTPSVREDLDQILITRDAIAARVRELGARITADLRTASDAGGLVIVPVLKGSIIFVADLIRELPLRVRMSLITVSSYPGRSTTTRGPVIRGEVSRVLDGRHVLIVDDILDSGRTIRLLRDEIAARSPLSIRTCVLLRKQIPSALETPCEYVGFDIPDVFVVGYGLDYDDYYRNLPEIGTLKREAMG